jgi:peroxiredoxin
LKYYWRIIVKKVFVLLILCLALFSCQSKGPVGTADIGQKAPDFTLEDLNGTKTGLKDVTNKVVVLEFWATWCPPCKTSVPELNKLNSTFIDKDFALLAISVDEGRNVSKTLGEFAEEYGVQYKILISDDLTSKLYGITSIPVIYLLDKQHTIVKKYTGYAPNMSEEISEEIKKLL